MKWKVLIVTNGKIIPDFYVNDKKFNNDNWSFFNVSNVDRLQSNKFNVINSLDVPGYEFLGKDWAESEVIYNVSKLKLFDEYDYLGIIHYDFDLYCKHYDTHKITENIENILQHGKEWISFFSGVVGHITGPYDVLLDERLPNCLFARDSGISNPKSANDFCMKLIGKNEMILSNDHPITLCCSFLCKKEKFFDIGSIIGKAINMNAFEKFDTHHRHRIPGQVMERLVALYSMTIDEEKVFHFPLDHKFTGGIELKMKDPNGENY